MNDHHISKTNIHLGGKDRSLCFDFNAICEVSKLTGLNLLEASVSTVEANNLRALLYASLLHDEPTSLTLNEVGSWITMKNLPEVRATILTAWFESVTDDEKTEGDNKPGEAQAQTEKV
jgi:hypothetical protein